MLEIQAKADDIWTQLARQELDILPVFGQSQGDFKTFDDLLANAIGTHASVAQFLFESTQSL